MIIMIIDQVETEEDLGNEIMESATNEVKIIKVVFVKISIKMVVMIIIIIMSSSPR